MHLCRIKPTHSLSHTHSHAGSPHKRSHPPFYIKSRIWPGLGRARPARQGSPSLRMPIQGQAGRGGAEWRGPWEPSSVGIHNKSHHNDNISGTATEGECSTANVENFGSGVGRGQRAGGNSRAETDLAMLPQSPLAAMGSIIAVAKSTNSPRTKAKPPRQASLRHDTSPSRT